MSYIICNTPIGAIKIIEEDGYIVKIEYVGKYAEEILLDNKVLKNAYNQINDYFLGTLKEFDLPIKLNVTPYREKVLNELMKVPYGSTITYKELAKKSGNVNAVRAVGSTMKTNPIPIIVPCHRVICSDGSLGNYSFGSVSNKDWLQIFEKQNI